MTAKVTEQGLLVPKDLLGDLKEVEIRVERNFIIITAPAKDPIFGLGEQPVVADVDDASVNHDLYLHG